MNQIGTKIHILRKNKNLTQSQLAEALSISAQSVSKWENNISSPDISLLPVIARFFGITMDELFNYHLNALNYKERFIRFMADNGVLQFGEFKLKSGRISPYFINTVNYKSASQIAKLGEFYAECIREHNIETNLLAGYSTAESPIVIATSIALFNRYGFDINHCIDNEVGKHLDSGDNITLIKDTLTSGNTLKSNIVKLFRYKKLHVENVIVSVDRMEKGTCPYHTAQFEVSKEHSVKIHSIVSVTDIISALENNIISGREYLDAIKLYLKKYGVTKNGY